MTAAAAAASRRRTSGPTTPTFDAVAAGAHATNGATALTWTHTMGGSGTNNVLFVPFFVSNWDRGPVTDFTRGVTVNGAAMTSLSVLDVGTEHRYGWLELFYATNVAAGSLTMSATMSSTPYYKIANSISYLGVGSLGTPAAAADEGPDPTVTVASASGHKVLSAAGSFQAFTAQTGTQRFLDNYSPDAHLLIQEAAGSGSVVAGTTANWGRWAAIGVDMIGP